jgi:hypothetical protein
MELNKDKYYAEESDLLTEAEKLQMVRDLRALELQGILEYRNGRWGLAAGAEIAETEEGPVARSRNKEQGGNVAIRTAGILRKEEGRIKVIMEELGL